MKNNQPEVAGDTANRSTGLLTTITLVSSAFTLLLISELIRLIYTPDLEAIRKKAATFLNSFTLAGIVPEPMEQAQYSVLLPATFVVLFLFWCGLRPALSSGSSPTRSRLFLQYLPSWLVGTLLLGLLFVVCQKKDFLYHRSSLLIRHPRLFLGVIFPLSLLAYFGLSKWAWAKLLKLWLPLFLVLIASVVFSYSLFTNVAVPFGYHFNPVVYPVALVRAGAPIGGDVLSLYGLYPVYICPILALFKPGLTAVCLLFGALVVVTCAAAGYALRSVIAHPFLALSATCAVPYFSSFGPRISLRGQNSFADPYFQYLPVRVVFPALVLAVLAWSVRHSQRQRELLALAAFLATTGLFWNLDSGVACVASVLAFTLAPWPFRLVRGSGSFLLSLREMVRDAGVPIGIGVVLASVVFYSLFWLQTGSMPSIPHYIGVIRTLADLGFSFLPIPPGVGYWHFMALCLAICSLLAFPLFWSGLQDKLASFHVAVSVMGLSLMVYYVGRSHDLNLLGPSWIIPIALSLIIERLLERAPGDPQLTFGRLAAIVGLAYVLSAPFSFALDLPVFYNLGRARWNAFRTELPGASLLEQNAEFIRNNSKGRKDVMVFAQDSEGILLLTSGRRPSVAMSSSTDLFLKNEHDRIVKFLQDNTDAPVFVVGSGPVSRSPEVNRILGESYVPAATNATGATLLTRRPTP